MKYKFYCNICKKKIERSGLTVIEVYTSHLREHIKKKVGNVYDLLGAILKIIELGGKNGRS